MKLLICFTLLFALSQAIQLPKEFEAVIYIQGRSNPEYNYTIFLQKTKESGILGIGKRGNEELQYKNGKLLRIVDKDVQCVDKDQVPPSNHLLEVLENAKPMEEKTISFDKWINKCNGKKYTLSYEGETLVLCEMNGTFQVIGPNLLIHIKLQPKKSSLIKINSSIDNCDETKSSFDVKTLSEDLWFTKNNICDFPWLADSQECQQHLLKSESEKKVCIFFHGSGETVTDTTIPEHSEYWGNLNQFTPQCKERRYVRQETKNRGWDDINLQKIWCQEATFDQEDKRVIKNKIIYSHSMGGLILSAAIRNKFCDIDRTTSWYTIASPYEGSQIATFVKSVCERKVPGILPSIYRYVSEVFGYCLPGQERLYRVYETLVPNFLYLNELVNITSGRVKGSLCGTSAYGLNTRYSVPLSVVASFAGYPEHNDGLVPQGSCKILGRSRGKPYEDDPSSKFYRPTTNHPDNTCRHGDGLWGSRRKPCSYFSNKI